MEEIILDAGGIEIKLGDKVFAGRSGYCYKGYIYRIDPDKVCISATNPKEKKPSYIGYSFKTAYLLNGTTGDYVIRSRCYSLLKYEE